MAFYVSEIFSIVLIESQANFGMSVKLLLIFLGLTKLIQNWLYGTIRRKKFHSEENIVQCCLRLPHVN